PAILILDDALSSVDTHTEAAILAGLKEVLRRRTSIIISHRITAIREADLIVVLDDRRIVEQGTHQTLLASGGLYTRMYRRQLLRQELAMGDVEELAASPDETRDGVVDESSRLGASE